MRQKNTVPRICFKQYDEILSLSKLKPNKFQRNKHPKEQIERLAKIMREHGVRHPIHISKRSKTVCFGHGRWEAAKANGWKDFPVVYQDFKSDKEEFACVQSDNAIASWAELDTQAIELDMLNFKGMDIELLGLNDFNFSEANPDWQREDIESHELEDKQKTGDKELKHILEVQFTSEGDMVGVYNDLLSRGFVVKCR